GRNPDLDLQRDGRAIGLHAWAGDVLESLPGICAALDADDAQRPYTAALQAQRDALQDPERLPSARVLAEMRARHESFFQFGQRVSAEHARYFRQRSLPAETEALFAKLARESLAKQARIEAADRLSFDDYLANYFAQS
ncbi:MAG TPA: glutamate--cysteine ligase, partial [Gammaproteobacteria bacterium]|nr:glutamate--cysteine ligase [Gammaproteobacteria bacterium]